MEGAPPASTARPTTRCGAGSRRPGRRTPRRRKSHFSEQHEKREGARAVKERLVKDAEALAGSTEWGPTSGEYRDLMRRWKAAGPAPRDVDEELWKRFRAAQDTFFAARDAANAAQDAEFAANAEVKETLLVEAEALVPVTDLDAAKASFREISERWDAAGKVPRERMRDLEGRIRKVEQAIRSVEDEQWRRTDPEKSARADDMVTKLEDAIAKIESDLARPAPPATRTRSRTLAEQPRVPPGLPRDGPEGHAPSSRGEAASCQSGAWMRPRARTSRKRATEPRSMRPAPVADGRYDRIDARTPRLARGCPSRLATG